MDFDYTTETITPESTGSITIGGTGALDLPNGTTAERPASPDPGMARYNTELNRIEVYQEGEWINYTDALHLPGSTFKKIQDFINIIGSRGTFSGGEFTDNGDGTIAVSGGTGQIHPTNSTLSALYFFDFATVPSLPLTNNALNYIFIDYNGGSPTVVASTTPNFDVDFIILGQVYRSGTVVTLNNYTRLKLDNSIAGTINRFESVNPFERESGVILSATGTRNFAVSAGAFWEGIDRLPTVARDTSAADTFTYWYRDTPSTWVSVPGQTQIDNSQYNNPSSGLATLGNKNYGCHWIYYSSEPGGMHVVYGITNTNLQSTLDSQPPPNPPNPLLTKALIGRIIIKKGDAAFTEVQSAFHVVFTGGTVNDHNELGGLQGGASDEYYHMTGSQSTVVGNLEGISPGVVVRLSSTAMASRTLTAGPGVLISDGDGVGGNPTISMSDPSPGGASGSLSWRFSSNTTAADPGGNVFRANNSTLASVTALYFNELALDNFDASTVLGFLQAGQRLYIQQKSDGTRAAVFEITGVATDNGSWWTVPVSVVSAGTIYQDNQNCAIVFILASGSNPGTVTSVAATQPAAGITIAGSPITTAGTLTFALANDLAALEGLASTGIAVRSAADTWVQRSVASANTKITVTNGDGVAGNPTLVINEANFTGIPQSAVTSLTTDLAGKQPLDATLTSLAAFNTNGLVVQTAADTFAGRTLTAPAAGFTITNPAGIAGNPTFVLANDLAAVEGLATAGIAVRTAADTWATRTITAASTKIAVTNGDGVAGNPTVDVTEANLTLNNIGGTLGIAKGGTNLTALGTANQLLGVNAGATALEYKTATAGTNVTITPTAGVLTIAAIPSGATTNVQYNNAGVLGGSAAFNFVSGANPYVSIIGTSATNQLRVGPAYTASGLAAQYQAGPATMYIETGSTDQDAQLVYFNSGTPGTGGYISYAYDSSTPYLRLTDSDDDPPYITFNTIGSGTYAAPQYVSTFGARGTYGSRTGGNNAGFAWHIGTATDSFAMITANTPTMELDAQFLRLPSGTTVQRPGTGVVGMVRYNTTQGSHESYIGGGAWATQVGVLDKSVATVAVTTASSTGQLINYSVPGGTLGTTNMLRIRLAGTITRTSGSNATFTITVSYGGTTMWTDVTGNFNANDGAFDMDFILAANSSATAQTLNGHIMISGAENPGTGTAGVISDIVHTANNTVSAQLKAVAVINGTAGVTSTNAQALVVSVTLPTGTNNVSKQFHIIEKI